jgi:uncharacterized membrane protein
MIFLLALLIGLFDGLRSMTAPAVVAWAVHLGWLKLDGPLAHVGDTVSVAILTLLAVGELIVDKLPQTPARTAPLGLGARAVAGGLAAACVMSSHGESAALGGLLGAIGGLIGAFAGYQARTRLVKALGVRDFGVAVAEDLVAIGGCVAVVALT